MPEKEIVHKNHAQHLKGLSNINITCVSCSEMGPSIISWWPSGLRALASPQRGPGMWPLWHLQSCFPYLRTPLAQFHCSSRFSKETNSIFLTFSSLPFVIQYRFLRVFLLGAFLPQDCFSVLDETWGRSSLRASVYFVSLQSSGNTCRFSFHGPKGPCLWREGMQSEAVTRIYTENISISFSANRSGYPSRQV